MANFENQDIGALQTAQTPTAPVTATRQVSTQAVAGGLKSLADLGGGLLETISKSGNSKALTKFMADQTLIADAVDQGSIGTKEARSRARANFVQFTGNNPSLLGDATKAHQAFVNTSGLGKVISEETEQEKMFSLERKSSFEAGFGADPEGVSRYRSFQSVQRDMENQKDRIALESSKVGLTQSKFSLREDVEKREAQRSLSTLADNANFSFTKHLVELSTQMNNGTISPEEAVLGMNSRFANIQSQASQVGAVAGGDYINVLMSPMASAKATFEEYAKGNITKEILDNQIDVIKAQQQYLMLQDPATASLVATTDMFKQNIVLGGVVEDRVQKLLTTNLSNTGKPADPLIPEASGYFNYLGQSYKNALKPKTSQVGYDAEKLGGELDTQLGNILKGIDAYKDTVDNPSDFKDVVEHLAGDSTGDFIVKRGIPTTLAAKASDVLKASYSDVILPMILKEFKSSQVVAVNPGPGMKGPKETAQVIVPVFSGTGVRFTANPETAKDAPALGLRNKLKHLNSKVAPILNTNIRAFAHLGGSKNYKGVWEDLFAPQFAPPEPKKEESK